MWRIMAVVWGLWAGYAGGWGLETVEAQSIDQLLEAAAEITPQASFCADHVVAPALQGESLRSAVKQALAATAFDRPASPQRADVAALVQVYRDLQADESLAVAQRHELRRAVSQRLTLLAEQLRRRLPVAGQQILGQQFNPVGAQQAIPGQATDPAQELIDVIQETIAPHSWDIRGGQGVVRFWGPGQALIIRQSSDVHGALAQLIADLHP